MRVTILLYVLLAASCGHPVHHVQTVEVQS